MKDSAPPNLVVAPTRASSAVVDERDAVATLAARLGASGARPAVQPTAIAPAPGASLAAHAAAAALGAGLAWVWPVLGLALIGATIWSAQRESDGAHGWVRDWIPRRVGHNVVLWGDRAAGANRPCLLIVAPLDGGVGRSPATSALLPMIAAPATIAALGVVLGWLAPQLGSTLTAGGAACLGVLALSGLLHALLRPWRQGPGPADALLEATRGALAERSPHHLDVVLAWLTGGVCYGDGLEILLKNNSHKLPSHLTRAVALVPAATGPSLVNVEGRWRRAAADPVLSRAAAEVGLPVVSSVTPAARATAAGWPSAALLVGPQTPPSALLRLVEQLDRAAGESRW